MALRARLNSIWSGNATPTWIRCRHGTSNTKLYVIFEGGMRRKPDRTGKSLIFHVCPQLDRNLVKARAILCFLLLNGAFNPLWSKRLAEENPVHTVLAPGARGEIKQK
jgi:hypothetical protein